MPAENQFYALFTTAAAESLAAAAEARRYGPGETLFEEGAPADAVYLIESGVVELVARGAPLGEVEAGKFIGELGVLADLPRTVGARALGEVAVSRIPVAAVQAVLETEPGATALAFLRRTVGYLKDANERYAAEVLRKGKLQLVGEMARSIIHDFRNPLGTIDLAAGFLSEAHDDPQTLNACRSISRQIERMAGMLQDLLDFAEGEVALDKRPTQMAGLLEEFRESSASRVRHAGVKLKLLAEPFVAVLDDRRILRALENMLQNSIQALAGRPGTVAVSARARDGRLELEVADDGPGIPEAVRATLFDPFVSHGKGAKTGLGLSVVRKVVEAHGGTLRAESPPRGGARFVIAMPLAAPTERALPEAVPVKRQGPRPEPV